MLNCTCALLHIKTNLGFFNPRGKKVQTFTLLMSPEVPHWLTRTSTHIWKDTQVPGCRAINQLCWKSKPAPGKPSLPHISLVFSCKCRQNLAHISLKNDLFVVPKFYVWMVIPELHTLRTSDTKRIQVYIRYNKLNTFNSENLFFTNLQGTYQSLFSILRVYWLSIAYYCQQFVVNNENFIAKLLYNKSIGYKYTD